MSASLETLSSSSTLQTHKTPTMLSLSLSLSLNFILTKRHREIFIYTRQKPKHPLVPFHLSGYQSRAGGSGHPFLRLRHHPQRNPPNLVSGGGFSWR
ncbi:hypothetical protein Hdeb2414_s0003g00095801 [Helianthus debilis subsp. tardiflorus]